MSRYHALDHPNPNALRKGYAGFWGYPTMNYDPDVVVVHTTESLADMDGPDTGAENVANWFQTNDVFALYHTLVDGDSTVRVVPAGLDGTTVHTAFHAAGYNSHTLGCSMALQAASWPHLPSDYRDRILDRAAAEVALWCRRWNIPPIARTKAEVDAGARGITGHGILDPGYRSDPGAGFPWDDFITRVNRALGNTTQPLTPHTATEDDLMLAAYQLPDNDAVFIRHPTGKVERLEDITPADHDPMTTLAEMVDAGLCKPLPSARLGWGGNWAVAKMDGRV